MSLSIVLLLISPLFAIPLFLLPNNKVRIFSFSLLIGFGIVLTLNIFNSVNNNFGQSIGKALYPLYSWLIDGNIELSSIEKYHISFVFTQGLLFFIFSIAFYIVFNVFYIGKNPSIQKNSSTLTLTNVFFRVVIYLISYTTVSFFLISIRNLTCMEEGFFSSLFNVIYYVGA